MDDLGTIGSDKVTVPGYYYKVLCSPKKQIMIGLILHNKSGTTPFVPFFNSIFIKHKIFYELNGFFYFSGLFCIFI